MRTKKENKPDFASLTEAKIEAWVGGKKLTQAQKILHNVSDIRKMSNHGFVASVLSGGDQVTLVEIDDSGSLSSECTCEAGCDCEHAAALALLVAESLQQKKSFAPIDADDPRLLRLDDDSTSEGVPRNAVEKKVFSWLESIDARKRFLLLIKFARKYPSVFSELKQEAVMSDCTDRELIAQTKEAIKKLGPESNWCKSKKDPRPNYASVQECITRLIDRKLYEPLLKIGPFFYEETNKFIHKRSVLDPEMRASVSSILCTIIDAVLQSDLADEEKLRFDYILHRYEKTAKYFQRNGFLEDRPSLWENPQPISQNAWSKMADLIAKELSSPTQEDFLYHEAELKLAYTHAGRQDEILTFQFNNIDQTCRFNSVSEDLFMAGRLNEAKIVCHKALNGGTWNSRPYLARLEAIETAQGNIALAASYAIERFFVHPVPDTFFSIQNICTQAGFWDRLRPMLLRYLETGNRDEIDTIPRPSIGDFKIDPCDQSFPDNNSLMIIALREQRIEDGLAILEQLYRRGNDPYRQQHNQSLNDLVADEIATSRPQIAFQLWHKGFLLVRDKLGDAAYEATCDYLKKMYPVAQQANLLPTWKSLITTLRLQYKNRLKLIEHLNALERSL